MQITNQEVSETLKKARKYVADFLSHAPGSSTAREVLKDVDRALEALSVDEDPNKE